MLVTDTGARRTLFPHIERVDADREGVEIVFREGCSVLRLADDSAPRQETANPQSRHMVRVGDPAELAPGLNGEQGRDLRPYQRVGLERVGIAPSPSQRNQAVLVRGRTLGSDRPHGPDPREGTREVDLRRLSFRLPNLGDVRLKLGLETEALVVVRVPTPPC